MSRTKHTILERIFLASPNDMELYRNEIRSIVEALNTGVLSRETLKFELKTAQNDVYASYGADPQFIINDQIGDDYEVIIVLFGTRIGSKTPREVGGTVEEFKRAAARTIEHGSPKIMIYFCEDLVNPFKIDAEQLAMVHDFKNSIDHKSFCKSFTKDTFVDVLENDLKNYLNQKLDEQPVRKKSSDATLQDWSDDIVKPD